MSQMLTEREFPIQRRWSLRFVGRIVFWYCAALLLALSPHGNRLGYAIGITAIAIALVLLFLLEPRTQHFSFEDDAFVFYQTFFRWRGALWRLPYADLTNVSVFQTGSDRRQHLASLVLENNKRLMLNTFPLRGYSNNPGMRAIAGTGPWNNLFVIDGLRDEDAQRLCIIVRDRMRNAIATPTAGM